MGSINTLTYLLFIEWFFKTQVLTDLPKKGMFLGHKLNSLKNSTFVDIYNRFLIIGTMLEDQQMALEKLSLTI